MANRFDIYLKKLLETPLKEHTEHTGRSALEALLNEFTSHGDKVQHEPKRETGLGAPDFKIKRAGRILGYVEVKEIGANLDKVLKSDQIKRYRALSGNILLTDYLQWVWIDREQVRQREALAFQTDLEGRSVHLSPERAEAVGKLIAAFFSEAPQGIAKSRELALALASRAQLLRDFLTRELARQAVEHREGRLHALFDVFRQQVFHELTAGEFADAFAQTLAYGLFLARLNAGAADKVTLENVRQHIPGSFQLIRELVRFLEEMNEPEYADARWIVDEVLSLVNGLDLPAIHDDLSFRQRKAISREIRAKDEEEHRLFEKDPFIYFYENFFREYDPARRKSRGVYYTPPPIVNFIVRAVDDILKQSFEIPDGLADHKRVTVLDFACGTGTFLLEVFERIFENIGGPDAGIASKIVREHLLKNIFGFEYLIAPYTIAHLKLSQYLKDKGHALRGADRLRVYLTNTLEPVEPLINRMLPALSSEVKAAKDVKDRDILVIVGNPPYSYQSRNTGAWITERIEDYRSVDGQRMKERVTQGLLDDYVKFIRFAQWKMEKADEGIVGLITNHSWLDNPTFRGMRQSLMQTFDQIYVVDLHGNTKKREVAPDGSKDENVFDIEQGVAVSLFIKKPGSQRGVWRGDFWGKRLSKYKATAGGSVTTLSLQKIEPVAPFYVFIPQNADTRREYESGISLNTMFQHGGTGMMTNRDRLTIHFDRQSVWSTVNRLIALDEASVRLEFGLGRDARDWTVLRAQEDIRQSGPNQDCITPVHYRPFDTRFTYYTGRARGFIGWPVEHIWRNMLHSNLALISSRMTKGETFAHVLVSGQMVEKIGLSPKTSNNAFVYPLYIGGSAENFSNDFRSFVDGRYEHHYTPEELISYIYAVLHSPTYRARYADFLRLDFPRIPFPDEATDFEALSALGWALVQAHLLRQMPRRKLATYHGKGQDTVEEIRYSPQEQAIWINAAQCFKPVPPDVWEFHIGGYQVLNKYLKSRKSRTLSLDEITHISAVADSLAFTIEQMQRIDEAYRAAFPGRG